MSEKQKKREIQIHGIFEKEKEDLCVTTDKSFIMLLPGSKMVDGDFKNMPTEPLKMMISQSGKKIFLDAMDLAGIEKLLNENRSDFDNSLLIYFQRRDAKNLKVADLRPKE